MKIDQTAFLTRRETEWLKGIEFASKNYEYKIKSSIRKKLGIFFETELPLIQNSGIFKEYLTLFGKDLTIISKINNIQNPDYMQIQTQNKSLGRDLDPGPLPYQGNALPG